MDPSIVKLLEEDEDESLHSGADVEAFQAALNRDIEGAVSASEPSDINAGVNFNKVLPEGASHTPSQSFAQWTSSKDENINSQRQQSVGSMQLQEHRVSELEQLKSRSLYENQRQQNDSQETNCMPLQQNQSQENRQYSSQITQTTSTPISEKNPVATREPERVHSQDSKSQYLKLQKMSNQQATTMEPPSNPMNRNIKQQVPFAALLPALLPQLDKDRAMQLHTLYAKLKKNEIAKEGFVRHMKDLVGDQMLKLAVSKMQLQLQQKASNSPSDPSLALPSAVKTKIESGYPTIENNSQKSREMERQSDPRGVLVGQMSSSSSSSVIQEREHSLTPVQGLTKQPQQHIQFPQSSFPIYGSGSGSCHPYSRTNVNTSVSSLKPNSHDSQVRQITHSQSAGSSPFGGASQPMNVTSVPKFERQNSISEPNKVQGGSLSHLSNNSAAQPNSVPRQALTSKEQSPGPLSSLTYVKQESVDQITEQQRKSHLSTPQGLSAAQVEQGTTIPGSSKNDLSEKQISRIGSLTSTNMMPSSAVSTSMTTQLDSSVPLNSRIPSASLAAGVNARTPPKKSSITQKKPLEALGSSPPQLSKKQKVSGAFSDQSIDQLNDVTAVSGVNLREEEEQLFSGSKEDIRALEASRRVVQEEEEKLLLQKYPLQKKLAENLARCGLKNISNDVDRCLSLCVEERMRGLICNIIRLSKQRVDLEKARHQVFMTSDVQQQIITINRKAREEWEKKQAEAEKLRKLDEVPEGDSSVDGDKEKDEARVKSAKVNKEEDDKMRTTAANVAARAAVGGDDVLSKWQLMAEARQKREGELDASSSRAGKDVSWKPLSALGRNAKDCQETEKRGPGASVSASGGVRKFGWSQSGMPQTIVARTLAIKDVIAVLEREPQMCKSTLMYRLCEKIRSEAVSE